MKYNSLIAAVINRAIDDIKGVGPRSHRNEADHAMYFILSETCEAYCLYLDINHEALKEKAAAFYRQLLAKETPDYRIKKTVKRSAKTYRRVHTRQSPGKLRSNAYK